MTVPSTSFGRRSVDWELKGVPVRVEIGPRDLAEGNVTVVTRHTREKETLPLAGVRGTVKRILGLVGPELLAQAAAARRERTVAVTSLQEAMEAGSAGFATSRFAPSGPTARISSPRRRCRSGASSAPTGAWLKPVTTKAI